MFRLIDPSSGQIQIILLLHSVSARIMGSHIVCTHWIYQYYVLYLAWWWLNEPKLVAELPTYVVFIDWINYCIIAKHNRMAPIKISFYTINSKISKFELWHPCHKWTKYIQLYSSVMGRDSSVSIVTRCGLDGPGIESRWGWSFPHLSRLPLRPTQPPVQWVPGPYRG
jgi:hypothetical protein